ncbi:MAG: hypothetical protein ABR509_01885 [Candidatus Limnocylindria bacterium]
MTAVQPPASPPSAIGPPPPGYTVYPQSSNWQYEAPGNRRSGMSARRVILIFAAVLIIILAIGTLLVFVLQPKPVEPQCPDPEQACGIPPRPPSDVPALVAGDIWSSDDLAFGFEYDGELWEIAAEDTRSVELVIPTRSGDVTFALDGASAADAAPDALMNDRVDALSERILGLTPETDAELQPLGEPIVGYIDGVGGVYRGTLDTPQGPGADLAVAVLAASDGEISIVVTVITPEDLRDAAFSIGDSILNTLRWPSETE